MKKTKARRLAKQLARQRGRADVKAKTDITDSIVSSPSSGATSQTRAKLEEDPLQKLVAAGLIDSAGERAAEEIKCVFLAVCRDVIAKTMRHGVYAKARFEISDELANAHSRRYLPWCRANRPSVVEATIDLVIDRKLPHSKFILTAICRAFADYAVRFDTAGQIETVQGKSTPSASDKSAHG